MILVNPGLDPTWTDSLRGPRGLKGTGDRSFHASFQASQLSCLSPILRQKLSLRLPAVMSKMLPSLNAPHSPSIAVVRISCQ